MTAEDHGLTRYTMMVAEYTGVILIVLWVVSTLTWWILAIPPTLEPPPEWLARAQKICFFTKEDGLPSIYGWGILAMGPVSLTLILLAGWLRELKEGFQFLNRNLTGRIILGLLITVVLAQATWMLWRGITTSLAPQGIEAAFPDKPFPEGYLRLNRPAPDFSLTDQKGRQVGLNDIRGNVSYVTFAFGNCATVCPLLVTSINRALEMAPGLNARMVVISLDAWRDTPSALEGIRTQWGLPESATLLSGDIITVNDVLDNFEITRVRDEKTGDIDHPGVVYVLDPKGVIAYALLNPSPRWLVEAGRRAAQEP
ncbi:MAG: SCO family protein [Deltaproteobacteria bacterium]|nr:SCO family protein [Deltaproteobacteria bacterium]